MKKTPAFLILLSSVAVFFLIISHFFNTNVDPIPNDSAPPVKTRPEKQIDINYSEISYSINWHVSDQPKLISLYSNVTDKLTSFEAKKEKSCKILVNGGFYDKLNEHIGLFIEDGNLISKSTVSSTFNSFISLVSNNIFTISPDEPETDVIFALQTGPLLILDDQQLELDLRNDKYARRVVLGITEEEEVIFLIIYDSITKLSGPLLSDLPTMLEQFEKQSGINIITATNLDGGGASAFITDEITLTESQLIGSYFCII